jgi:hypothetical protein
MKLNISAELTGAEVAGILVNQLACSEPKIIGKTEQVTVEVLNKENKWVTVPLEKVKFIWAN